MDAQKAAGRGRRKPDIAGTSGSAIGFNLKLGHDDDG